GFIAPSSGAARIGGLDVVEESLEVRRQIGYLPENAPVYQDMLVGDYLGFVAEVRGLRAQDRARRIDAVVSQVGLGDVVSRPIAEISKGFRQRVGLAQALVHDPPILILDEPTTGLDPNQIAEIRKLILDIGRTKTVLLSTHILPEVQAVCGRVIIVDRGKIVGYGTPAELEAQAQGRACFDLVVAGEGDFGSVLGSLAGVTEVRSAAGEGPGTAGYTIYGASGSDLRPSVFRAAADGGWTLLELRRQSAGLEGVFRDLTAAE
ncbi:MAG: ATP-binding cassette domain-containing protein, partial [Myxococcota bacterium]|nr:ATP-binding cassette domain-containing protein [Myxococcota bacterium]